MTAEPLREHLEWHLRRLKGARAAAAEMSLRPRTDGLEWLALTHFAVLALEATLAEEVAPDHKALEEVVGDLSALRRQARAAPAPSPPPAPAAQPDPVEPRAAARDLAPLAESWSTALASFQALAFPWRTPARPPGAGDSNLRAP